MLKQSQLGDLGGVNYTVLYYVSVIRKDEFPISVPNLPAKFYGPQMAGEIGNKQTPRHFWFYSKMYNLCEYVNEIC